MDKIEKIKLNLKGVFILKTPVYKDKRGSFSEIYSNNFNQILGIDINWVQDNESISNKNVFRGLHFQKKPFAQSKLLRVSNGKILDIMFDLRKNSETFMKYIFVKLFTRNMVLFIPKGIAHGFLSLSDKTIVNYKCDNYYNHKFESGLNPFKSNLKINWGVDLSKIIISKKDKLLPSFEDVYLF